MNSWSSSTRTTTNPRSPTTRRCLSVNPTGSTKPWPRQSACSSTPSTHPPGGAWPQQHSGGTHDHHHHRVLDPERPQRGPRDVGKRPPHAHLGGVRELQDLPGDLREPALHLPGRTALSRRHLRRVRHPGRPRGTQRILPLPITRCGVPKAAVHEVGSASEYESV